MHVDDAALLVGQHQVREPRLVQAALQAGQHRDVLGQHQTGVRLVGFHPHIGRLAARRPGGIRIHNIITSSPLSGSGPGRAVMHSQVVGVGQQRHVREDVVLVQAHHLVGAGPAQIDTRSAAKAFVRSAITSAPLAGRADPGNGVSSATPISAPWVQT